MKYVPSLPLRREVYSIIRAENVDHSEVLTDFYLAAQSSPESIASPLKLSF
jgi:hypothetical protein